MSATARTQIFSAVHTIGGLLPADMLVRISEEGRPRAPSPPTTTSSARVPSATRPNATGSTSSRCGRNCATSCPSRRRRTPPPTPPALRSASGWSRCSPELSFGRLTALGSSGIDADDGTKTFPISHLWTHAPIHLTTWNTRLDTRPGGPGTIPPQSLMQECLNRTEAHLWAVLTNGRQLRLLRDSSALATAAYVEFDLEAIFDGELFSEFVLLYRLLHASRFAVDDGAGPSTCWLEKWRTDAIDSGTRALDHHRDGVQRAITALGTGFLKHPANTELLRDLDVHAFHGALLRLAYRLIFLFVAEDRDVLHPKGTPDDVRDRYRKYFRPRGSGSRRCGVAAPRTPTCTKPSRSCWTPWGRERTPRTRHPRTRRPLRRRPRRRPAARTRPVERAPAGGRPPPVPHPRRRHATLAPGRLPQHGRGGTRLHLRVAARTRPRAQRRGPDVRAGRPARQRPQEDRLVLHAEFPDRDAARLHARPGHRRRPEARRGEGRRSRRTRPDRGDRLRVAVVDRLRPGLRLWTLPGRLGPPHRQARRRCS